MDTEKLYNLIDRYFEGDTTLEEEDILVSELMARDDSDARIKEAKAVILFLTASPDAGEKVSGMEDSPCAVSAPVQRGFRGMVWKVAAAVAVVATGGFFLMRGDMADSGYDTVAWCNGVRVDDPEVASGLMRGQLAMMADVSASLEADVEADFSEFADAMVGAEWSDES